MNIIQRELDSIRPYTANAKKHDATQVANVAESIRQYGFVQPIVIDRDGVIVIGHCRALAAKKLGMNEVPCVCVDDLTPEQVKALRIVDNKSNESPWDFDILPDELAELDLSDFDFDFGIDDEEEDTEIVEDDDIDEQDRLFKERMARGEISEEDEEYQAFLEKFEAKKTTDDCYTPDNIYDAVKEWCIERYGLRGKKIIRPFYPGGDYQKEDYSGDCVVIDNPPFSIISEICEWYSAKGIKYFMFAPRLTLLGINRGRENYVVTNNGILYENGAVVNTGFVTNLGKKKIISAPDLHELVEEQNKINAMNKHRQLPRYEYPPEVLTSSMLGYMAQHGIALEIEEKHTYFIRALDSQKESGKGLFGSGFLLSEKAAAEKAAAEKAAAEKAAAEKVDTNIWELSDREREIVKSLGK